MKFPRTVTMMALLLAVTACSHKKPTTEDTPGANSSLTNSTTNGTTGAATTGMASPNAAVPGSQQDLVVNVGDRVFFDYDQYSLSSEAQHTLSLQADWLKKYPNVHVQISGNCDERGTREFNLALGDRRATSAKNYLVSLGISADRITTISYGKERPAVEGSNPSAWAQNRRDVTEVQ